MPSLAGCGKFNTPIRHAVTRKTALTDPKSRWRGNLAARNAGDAQSEPTSTAAESSQLSTVPAPPIADSQQHPPASIELEVRQSETGPEQKRSVIVWLGSVRASPWLLSAAIHLVVLIVLALLTYQIKSGQPGLLIEGVQSQAETTVRFETIKAASHQPRDDGQSTDQVVAVELPVANPSVTAPNSVAPNEAAPLDQSPLAALKAGAATSATNQHVYLGGGGMSARTPEGRQEYGDLFGANAASEKAVENALRWLAIHQRSNGSWSFDLQLSPCDGQCANGKRKNEDTPTPSTAATGLALLAFLGAGYTSEVGPYKDQVSRGLYYLKSVAVETSHGYDWQQGGSMYGHGIALMAISEALGMTKLDERYDSDLLYHAEQGTRFTVTAQHPSGSWGYVPGSPGDTTLTGWQILSLIGAKKAGIQTRSDTFSRAKGFLMSIREEPGYQFGYRTPKAEPTTTAIALSLLMYLGQKPGYTYFDRAIDKLAKDGPKLTNVYHDYYATMALHHFRHRDWETWNTKVRDHLVRTQATDGHEAGSWHFKDKWGDVGGRVYTTAMSTLILEVYYRFLPLYDQPPEFPL